MNKLMRTSRGPILQHPSWLLSSVCRDNLNSNTNTKYLTYFIKTLGSKGGGTWHRGPPMAAPLHYYFWCIFGVMYLN